MISSEVSIGIDLPIIGHTGLKRHVAIERLDGYVTDEVFRLIYSTEPGLCKAKSSRRGAKDTSTLQRRSLSESEKRGFSMLA
jgi:hypothetical protein